MQKAYEERYHQAELDYWWFVGRRHIVRMLVEQERPDKDSRILEIGCSGGLLMKELQALGLGQPTGIDISSDAIALCRRAGLDAHQMDAQELALPASSFDVVTASDVLEHLVDEAKAVQEWKRVLKPAGLLIVFVPAFKLLWSKHDEANKHYRRYRRARLVHLLEFSGYVIERSSYWNMALFAPIAAVRLLGRLRAGRDDPKAEGDLTETPKLVNFLLASILRLENWFLRLGVNWPFGVSVFVLARKASTIGPTTL
jgi:ubiquinone/menaquinone biosynthesis C-methylase UbiE